jgi:hypothetical protein
MDGRRQGRHAENGDAGGGCRHLWRIVEMSQWAIRIL